MALAIRGNMQTQTAEQFQWNFRARINAGASISEAIYGAIREGGPLRTVRVSSAQARGAAKHYPYWGAVRYAVKITRAGNLSAVALERASSDRRSVRKAEEDAWDMAVREGRVRADWLGTVTLDELAAVGL